MYISFYGIWPEMEKYLKTKLKGQKIKTSEENKIDLKKLDKQTEVLAVFVESPVTKQVIEALPKLKLIVTMSTGFDHIDLVAAKNKNIPVCNVPCYGENTVAEQTFALILGLTRKLFLSVERVKQGAYDFHGLRGIDLKGKTLGVVGTGHIGQHVIRMAKGFEMKIIAYDKFAKLELAKSLGFTYTTLPKLLSESDIVTLHTPLFKETYHLINKSNIKKMKKSAYLVNTARGALVDAAALASALKTNAIAGAGLDVLEDENLLQHHEQVMRCTNCELKTTKLNEYIIHHPNTIVTPHNAFNSTEALERIADVTIENITSFAKGKLLNEVK